VKINGINRKTALEFLGVKGDVPDDITALIEKYEPLLLEKITPRYVYIVKKREQISALLKGEDIKEHLKNCDNIILLAATAGLACDELIRYTETHDMAGAVVLDALASAAIEQICDRAEYEIKRKYGEITTRFSPGYGDFPLDVQKNLLAVLEAKKTIGLYSIESDMLLPRKSVTAVIGILGG